MPSTKIQSYQWLVVAKVPQFLLIKPGNDLNCGIDGRHSTLLSGRGDWLLAVAVSVTVHLEVGQDVLLLSRFLDVFSFILNDLALLNNRNADRQSKL